MPPCAPPATSSRPISPACGRISGGCCIGAACRSTWLDEPAATIASLRDEKLLARITDPQSEKRQQPAYAANWHRSIDPAVSVLVGVCTYCACMPQFSADAPLLDDVAGGYSCPCCASHFDAAGRPHRGPAQYNLPVPPYEIVTPSRLVIGRNKSDALFTIESIERI
jgi:ubiquinol-cytochrome c reductase iron-sulfur subunit